MKRREEQIRKEGCFRKSKITVDKRQGREVNEVVAGKKIMVGGFAKEERYKGFKKRI